MTLANFEFNNTALRTSTLDGEPWFVAKDVCDILNISNSSDALSRLDDDEKGVANTDTLGGKQEMAIINESGLYSLILTSRKPEAKAFKKWITSEVLPTIRKTGSYSVKPKTPLELAKEQVALYEAIEAKEKELQLAIATKAEIGHRREATAMNTASQAVKQVNRLEIELDKSKEYCTVKRMEMLQHGLKFEWRKLKSAGSDLGIDSIDVFDANYGKVKAYHKDVWLEAYALTF
jgi:prophage antirepressor-like protein